MKIIHGGKVVPLDHLYGTPVSFNCPCEDIGRELIIRVQFSHHCFSIAYDGNVHTLDQVISSDGPGRDRVFCPIRYGLSRRLPALVCDLPKYKVHQTATARNYVHFARVDVSNQVYGVYFTLQRAQAEDQADLRLHVESAYTDDGGTPLRKRPRAIRFIVLARKVLRNEPIRFAPR